MSKPVQANLRPHLTARMGAARMGASRMGYIPKDVRSSPVGYYFWDQKQGPLTLDDSVTWASKQR